MISCTVLSMIYAAVATRRCATDRKSTRLNSSHLVISYAVFCLKKKKIDDEDGPALHRVMAAAVFVAAAACVESLWRHVADRAVSRPAAPATAGRLLRTHPRPLE